MAGLPVSRLACGYDGHRAGTGSLRVDDGRDHLKCSSAWKGPIVTEAAAQGSRTYAPEQDAPADGLYDYYREFRERAPIAMTATTYPLGMPGVAVLRFHDVQIALRDNRLRREIRPLMPPDWQPEPTATPGRTIASVFSGFMLFRDPPHHTRLRSTANLAFTPRRVEAMRPTITALADSLVDDLVTSGDPRDLIRAFAYPLPIMVISEMLGIPQEDFPRFREWSLVIAAAIDIPPARIENFAVHADRSATELVAYLARIVEERRARPRADLISSLIHAETTEGRITTEELISTCILLLVAGHETTVNLITNGTLALLSHPDQWRRLVARPDLARNATEELLRFDSPVQMTDRVAHDDIPRGTNVQLVLGSANRDPRQFAYPDRLDIQRDVGRIMSFGQGIHFCVGAALARLEGEIAFGTLARRASDLRLVSETQRWRPGLALRGLEELPVTTGPADS